MNDVFIQLYASIGDKVQWTQWKCKETKLILFFHINIIGAIQVFTFYVIWLISPIQKFEEKYSHSNFLGEPSDPKSDCGKLKKMASQRHIYFLIPGTYEYYVKIQ